MRHSLGQLIHGIWSGMDHQEVDLAELADAVRIIALPPGFKPDV